MWTYFFIFLFLVSVAVIAVIVFRKFPLLSNLDMENLPAEKEARKKKEIITRRVEAEGARVKKVLVDRAKPLGKIWGQLQLKFRIYVGRIERLWHHEQRAKRTVALGISVNALEEQENKLQVLLREGNICLQNGKLERAEEIFIAAIKLDQKSASAYRGLADTYFLRGALVEAEETYSFLLQLQPMDDMVMVKLAEIAEQKGDIERAIQFYQQAVVINDSLSPRFYHLAELLLAVGQPMVAKEAVIQAVELEPKNPKYLDLLIESVILCNDKQLAMEGYEQMRLVNPDNQKLPIFKERIEKIP